MIKKYFLFFLLIPLISFAHQPRFISDNKEDQLSIKNSEVSQAFYGELNGESDIFNLEVEGEQDFYFGLLAPDLPGINKDFSAILYWEKDGASEVIASLKSEDSLWEKFYEKFAGDSYFKGPEKKIKLGAGDYFIRVQSPENKGKYVLVVGQKESFPPNEIIKALYVLPLLKHYYWGESFLDGYLNIFGGIVLLFILLLSFSIYFIFKKLKKNK